jgi:hypothetical protein
MADVYFRFGNQVEVVFHDYLSIKGPTEAVIQELQDALEDGNVCGIEVDKEVVEAALAKILYTPLSWD